MRSIAPKIYNIVSDQASVSKKFVTLLAEWRENAFPHVIDHWESLLDNQKERYASINYFCGLHFLVGLSEQAICLCGRDLFIFVRRVVPYHFQEDTASQEKLEQLEW